MKRRISCVCAVLFGMLLATTHAGAPYLAGLLRDETALGLTPTTKNLGMGGAYVGVNDVMSMNPAALAFAQTSSLSLGGVTWNPKYGANVVGGRVDVVFPTPLNSHTRIMAYRYETRGTGTVAGLGEMAYESTTFGLQLGIPLTETLALGIGAYPYESGKIDTQTPAFDSEAMSQIGSAQVGLLWNVAECLSIGLEGIYIRDEMQQDLYTGNYAGGDDGYNVDADDYNVSYGAVGIGWRPREGTLVAVDYRTGEIEGKTTATGGETDFDQDVDRWSFGISQNVCSGFVARVGSNNGGLTLGASFLFSECASLDYAFAQEAHRDKEFNTTAPGGNVFGRTKLHSVTFSYNF